MLKIQTLCSNNECVEPGSHAHVRDSKCFTTQSTRSTISSVLSAVRQSTAGCGEGVTVIQSWFNFSNSHRRETVLVCRKGPVLVCSSCLYKLWRIHCDEAANKRITVASSSHCKYLQILPIAETLYTLKLCLSLE